MTAKRIAILASLCFILCGAVCIAAPTYQIHDLTSGLGNDPEIYGINNNGDLTGSARFTQGTHAFRWSQSAGLADLGTYGGGNASAGKAINDRGQVTGFSRVAITQNGQTTQTSSAMVWNPDGTEIHLGTLPGAWSSYANSINNLGQVLGGSLFETFDNSGQMTSYSKHAVIWNADGSMEDLGELFHTFDWDVLAINDSGDALGYALMESGFRPWVCHPDGSMTFMDTTGEDYNEAKGMNGRGEVVGSLGDSAVVWNPDGGVARILAPIDGLAMSSGYGINSIGAVVGESFTMADGGDATIHATLWNQDGSAVYLGSLPGYETSRAWCINDNGWIVGEVGTNGDWRTVLWTPVPEPASIVALFTGIAAVSLRKRR